MLRNWQRPGPENESGSRVLKEKAEESEILDLLRPSFEIRMGITTQRMTLSGSSSSTASQTGRRKRNFLWLLLLTVAFVLIVGYIFEFAHADENIDSLSGVQFAVRKVLSHRAAESRKDIEDDTDGTFLFDTANIVEALDDEDEDIDRIEPSRIASLICALGAVFSIYTLVVEHMRWDPKSFQRFSIATKIPVEVFCVSGPLVLVSSIIYSILAGLLLTGGGSSSAFFIASSWSAIMIDMSFVCYANPLWEIVTSKVDFILHIVNILTVINAFNQLRFFPYTFVICGLSFWGVVIGIRVFRKLKPVDRHNSGTAGFRPGSP